MQPFIRAAAFLTGLLSALIPIGAGLYGQTPTPFPQTLPPNTVVGRLGIASGPAQAISFATLSTNLFSPRTDVADAGYAVLAADTEIAYTSLSTNRTVSLLPAAAYRKGQTVCIRDVSGSASGTKKISVAPSGTDTINASNTTQVAVQLPYAGACLESNGAAAWTIQASSGGGSFVTGNMIFYIATTGNDSNNCITVGAPCATFAGAWALAKTYNFAGWAVNFVFAAGTYTSGIIANGGLVGLTDRNQIIVSGTSAIIQPTSNRAVFLSGGAALTIHDLTLDGSVSGGNDTVTVTDKDTSLVFGNNIVIKDAASGTNFDVQGGTGSFIEFAGALTINKTQNLKTATFSASSTTLTVSNNTGVAIGDIVTEATNAAAPVGAAIYSRIPPFAKVSNVVGTTITIDQTTIASDGGVAKNVVFTKPSAAFMQADQRVGMYFLPGITIVVNGVAGYTSGFFTLDQGSFATTQGVTWSSDGGGAAQVNAPPFVLLAPAATLLSGSDAGSGPSLSAVPGVVLSLISAQFFANSTTIALNAGDIAAVDQYAAKWMGATGYRGLAVAAAGKLAPGTVIPARSNISVGGGSAVASSASAASGGQTVTVGGFVFNGGLYEGTYNTPQILGPFAALTSANLGIVSTSSTGVPSVSTAPVVGGGGATGTLGFGGGTSGTVTVQPQAVAGTYNFNLPITAGTAGQCLVSQGGGATAMTWGACSGGGGGTPGGADTQVQFNNAAVFGGSANLTWVTPTLKIGVAGSTTGVLQLTGLTSGTVSIQGVAVAGTYNFNLPTGSGTANQLLTSQGGGASAQSYQNIASLLTQGSGITITGTTNATISLTSPVTVSLGGTGQTTLTNHGVLVGAGTSGITALVAAGAGTVLTGTGVDPAFSTAPQLGSNGGNTGTLLFAGTTSGVITVQSQSVEGTYNFNLPTSAGTANQVLTSQAGGASAQTYQNIASLLTAGVGISLSGTTNATVAVDPTYLNGFIAGCNMSTPGGATTVTITACTSVSADGATLQKTTSSYTKTMVAWVVGSGNGGLDTGSIAANTWYYIWQITRTDTNVTDFLVSASATAPTMPTNYTKKRLIAFARSDATPNLIQLTQYADEFIFGTAFADINTTPGDTVAHTATLTVPSGTNIKVRAKISVFLLSGVSVNRILVSSLDETDQNPAAGNFVMSLLINSGFQVADEVHVMTNTSGQVRYRVGNTDTAVILNNRGFRYDRTAN